MRTDRYNELTVAFRNAANAQKKYREREPRLCGVFRLLLCILCLKIIEISPMVTICTARFNIHNFYIQTA
jgi:hypothetical protein